MSPACRFNFAGSFLALLFDPEDGSRIFLLNVLELVSDYTPLHTRRLYSQISQG
jgi:hypothetical protein